MKTNWTKQNKQIKQKKGRKKRFSLGYFFIDSELKIYNLSKFKLFFWPVVLEYFFL